MDIRGWDERYRSRTRLHEGAEPATPLLVKTASRLRPGKALDLACGTGRNSLWLAEHGWSVTAVDGSAVAIEVLRLRTVERDLTIESRIADLKRGEYSIAEDTWDLVAICFYLQRDLFEPIMRGIKGGGLLIAIPHITEDGEEPTESRLRPGELPSFIPGWEILHYREGKPDDPAHKRAAAEIVARRPRESIRVF